MAFKKFASFESSEVLEVKGSNERIKTASLDRVSDYNDYRTDDGYMYVRIRAISSRVNKNNDGWPSVELAGSKDIFDRHQGAEGFTVTATDNAIPRDENGKAKYGFATFLGKPHFVDHNNSDPKRTRGAVVDAKFNVLDHKTASGDKYWAGENVDPEHLPAAEVELLIEVDAKSFPVLAKAIRDGDIDGFSMGCDVDKTVCNICSKEAHSPADFCQHIRSKGATFDYRDSSTGHRTSKRSYENCYGIKFFEISAVFDPADETALLRELVHKEGSNEMTPLLAKAAKKATAPLVRGMKCPTCGGLGCEYCGNTGEIRVPEGSDGTYFLEGDQGAVGGQPVPGSFEGPMLRENEFGGMMGPNLTMDPEEIRRRNLGPVRQGSKTADNPTPQSELTKAPEDVDTLRKEQVCPICGADMDSGKCEVCGHEEPPDGLNTPDLEQAHNVDEEIENSPADMAGEEEPQSPLEARKPQVSASVTSETMKRAWQPIYHPKVSGRINTEERPIRPTNPPVTNEPQETIIKDEPTPVTSSTRAADLIAAAGQSQQENSNMSDEHRVAAEPADPSGKPDKRVNVEGVGAVYPGANAEDASKPENKHGEPGTGTRTDVEGIGGVIEDSNAEAAKADERVNLGERQQDNAGFQEGGKTGPPTKTWSENNGTRAVTDKAFPTSAAHEAAKEGVKPIGGPDVQPERRENLEQESGFSNPQKGTDQWTGTGGNRVLRQQDPVTKKVDPNIEQPRSSAITSHVVNVFKLADAEIELGITDPGKKYDRVAELEQADEAEVAARLDTLSRVKTAGLAKPQPTVQRLPSLKREAAVEPTQEKTSKLDDPRYDAALFGL